ncbi:hypothetical protein LDL08_26850 [Nonomuraea glycinis]|uniref:Uncharacterized protein n=1 Tax=Nonomuraea glycinis TaxID=2047744 RepID=A0A918E9F8_9ACTN|nr:hypothetical protein [Nonomuraea glycinis]MCA2179803.1 hypothetical protein [Nonomuraea glycinis]GGP16612.1 hypothetical protein GCM10012278_81150 [Nonomuraea glycinis]
MIRTPWPSRSAPHHWIACRINGRRVRAELFDDGGGDQEGRVAFPDLMAAAIERRDITQWAERHLGASS